MTPSVRINIRVAVLMPDGLKIRKDDIQLFESIIKAVEELNEDKVINLVKFHLSNGENPTDIINAIQRGMIKVGELFETKKFYLADLIMAGTIFRGVLGLEEMRKSINKRKKEQYVVKPLILIGTIKDDLHDIGKEIFSGMAKSFGYDVIDLGVDISPQAFLDNYYRYKPDIIAISGVLTDSIRNMKAVVDLFKEKALKDQVKIIIGGSPVTKEAFDFIGADGYSRDVKQGIEICNQWTKTKNGVI